MLLAAAGNCHLSLMMESKRWCLAIICGRPIIRSVVQHIGGADCDGCEGSRRMLGTMHFWEMCAANLEWELLNSLMGRRGLLIETSR